MNLSAVLKAADTGSNIAAGNLYASLSRGIPSDPTFMVWYDITRTEPFFIKGAGIFADILRLYTSGIAAVRATPTELQVSLSAARVVGGGARLAAGFPLAPEKGVGQDLLAFRFADSRAARLSWVKAKSLLVLADAGGTPIAQAQLDPDTRLVPEQNADGALAALWAVSPSGTIWRFGPALIPQAPFPVASGIVSTMPPIVIGGSLALFSRNDAAIVLIGADGARRLLAQHLDAPLLAAPDVVGARMAFYPKSFDAHVHLTDLDGTEGRLGRRLLPHPGGRAPWLGRDGHAASRVPPEPARCLLRKPRDPVGRRAARSCHPRPGWNAVARGHGREHPAAGQGP